MEKGLNEEEKYGRYKRESLSGESGKRNNEKIKISLKTYQKNLAIIAATSALTVALAIGGGTIAANNIKDSITLNSLAYQFSREVISPETHRTDNNQYYFFDYSDIADRIFSMENPDLGFYLFYANEGRYQTDKLMQETRYRSFENYLQEHNFEDEKDFEKTMEKVAILTNDVNENNEKLEEIAREHKKNDNQSYGGK